MKIVDTGDPGVLELRSKVIGCLVLAGLVFITGGGLTIAFTLGAFPAGGAPAEDLRNISLLAGGLSILLGLVFVGGRRGKTLDGRRRSLTSWSGFLVPMREKHIQLQGYSWVVVTKEAKKGNQSNSTLFPVRLEGDGKAVLEVGAGTDPLDARRLAEAVAKVLRLPMTDSTSGDAVIRDADHLDEPLRERLRRLGERIELPPRPEAMRSHIQITTREVTADLPGMSTKARFVMNTVVILLGLGSSFGFFGMQFITGPLNQWFDILPALLFSTLFVALPLVIILSKLRRFNRSARITANRVALTVVQGGKTTEIPGDELEQFSIEGQDLHKVFKTLPDGSLVIDPASLDTPEGTAYTSKHGEPPTVPPALAGAVRALGQLSSQRMSIFACSDRTSVRFGRGLDADEITYLYSAILKVIAG